MLEKFLKKSSWTDIVLSLIFILFGILLITNPGLVVSMISIILGGIIIAIGVFRLIDYFSTNKTDNYLLAIAIVAIVVGVIVMFCADIILSAFRILIAIWIIYSGIMNLQTAIVWKEFKSRLWLISIILSILTIASGIYVLINNGAIMQTIGAIVIIYGIIEIIENVIFIKKINQ